MILNCQGNKMFLSPGLGQGHLAGGAVVAVTLAHQGDSVDLSAGAGELEDVGIELLVLVEVELERLDDGAADAVVVVAEAAVGFGQRDRAVLSVQHDPVGQVAIAVPR